jgi:hypothetical protein
MGTAGPRPPDAQHQVVVAVSRSASPRSVAAASAHFPDGHADAVDISQCPRAALVALDATTDDFTDLAGLIEVAERAGWTPIGAAHVAIDPRSVAPVLPARPSVALASIAYAGFMPHS